MCITSPSYSVLKQTQASEVREGKKTKHFSLFNTHRKKDICLSQAL